jgi:hypothetical protein
MQIEVPCLIGVYQCLFVAQELFRFARQLPIRRPGSGSRIEQTVQPCGSFSYDLTVACSIVPIMNQVCTALPQAVAAHRVSTLE